MTHLEKFQKRLQGAADAALITGEKNRFYLCNFPYSDGYLLIFTDCAYLLTDFRYEEAARREASEEFTVLSPATGILSAAADLLRERGVKTLLLEENEVTLGGRSRLAARFEEVTLLEGASEILTVLRRQKDAREIAAIRTAQEITDAAFTHILDFIHAGRTEREIALELEFFMRRNGAEGVAFDTIAVSGSLSAVPHGVPRDCVLEKGFLTMDFGARYGGYCADMTRTVCIGHADGEMRRLYDTVLQAQRAALGAIRGGMPCREMDKIARDIIHGAGYVGCFGHSLGHGVGLDVHESPSLSARAPEEMLLAPGHVVSVEPGIYISGKYGCRIEDLVVIGEDNAPIDLTQSDKELIEICR